MSRREGIVPPTPAETLELAQGRVRSIVPDADLSALAVFFTLIRASERVTHELEGVQRPMGWTWPGFRVLFWIWLLGPLEPRAISTLASASRASVSSALNTLERNGFVVRRRASSDRRLVTVELTEQGAERISAAFVATNRREHELASVFSLDERRLLTELLGRLLEPGPEDKFNS